MEVQVQLGVSRLLFPMLDPSVPIYRVLLIPTAAHDLTRISQTAVQKVIDVGCHEGTLISLEIKAPRVKNDKNKS